MIRARGQTASLLFVALVSAQVGLAWGAALFSDGLFRAGPDGPLACRDLRGSYGFGDEVLLLLFVPAMLSALVRSLRLPRRPGWGEAALLAGLEGLPIMVLLGSWECADVRGSVAWGREPGAVLFVAVTLLVPVALGLAMWRGGPGREAGTLSGA